ncbi:hypothetical protein CVT24_007088 [Panaeolus cyanescens]|uniref:Transmembrane protein n=1 Tax=Panaeolus cyanescens TaxID=181874 RepID=A0A409YP35_9AGAR|nr:hypothetical protein CVT24_007088 [Panaeolus cyanescens]
MVNWMDPVVITRTSKVFGSFSLVLTGVACWDVLSNIWFDYQIITGKRKFKWPMIIYWVARISMLLHIFAITINRNALSEVPCTELTFMSKFCDAVGTCCSGLILALRTRAVWHRDWKVSLLMLVLFLGQIGMWAQTFRFSTARWNPQRMLCDVLSTAPAAMLVSIFAYTMVFDLIILILCTYRLLTHKSSTLGHVLLRDGIGYFCFVFGANLIQTVFAGLHYNPVMNIMCLPFALVVSVIAATTVFRNVFTAYDAFDEGYTSSTGRSTGLGALRTGARIQFWNSRAQTTTVQQATTNEIPLGDYKDPNTISIHRVVDVEVQGATSTDRKPVSFDAYSPWSNLTDPCSFE